MKYRIYTDGGCRNTGNKKGQHVKPNNKSAYAFLITRNGKRLYAHTHGYYGKTNNQMEVAGVLQALHYGEAFHINNQQITIVSDSKYVDDTINKHRLPKWHRYNFSYKGKLKPNAHLWSMMYDTLQHYPHIQFKWTKGHASGQTQDSRGNIFVDHTLNHTMDKLPDLSASQAQQLNQKQATKARAMLQHKNSNFYSARHNRANNRTVKQTVQERPTNQNQRNNSMKIQRNQGIQR